VSCRGEYIGNIRFCTKFSIFVRLFAASGQTCHLQGLATGPSSRIRSDTACPLSATTQRTGRTSDLFHPDFARSAGRKAPISPDRNRGSRIGGAVCVQQPLSLRDSFEGVLLRSARVAPWFPGGCTPLLQRVADRYSAPAVPFNSQHATLAGRLDVAHADGAAAARQNQTIVIS
jgi:hypothetical protein